MPHLKKRLADIIPIESTLDCDITGLSQDSRRLKAGDLFFAYAGLQADGRDFIQEALDKGAAAVLVEPGPTFPAAKVPIIPIDQLSSQLSEIAARFYDHPAQALKLVGITGSNGKTSCTHFIAACLEAAGQPCGLIGGLGNGRYAQRYGPTSTQQHQHPQLTTPDAIELQALLADFRDQGISTVAIEVSSHRLAQGRLTGIPFTIAGFTNLDYDHLDYHGTMAAYAAAKRRLFASAQHAVLNRDDPIGAQWQTELSNQLPVYTYALSPPPLNQATRLDCHATLINPNSVGLSTELYSPWGVGYLHNAQLIGQFNLSNLLLVVTVLGILGLPLAESLTHIAHLQPVLGRMTRFGGGSQPLVIVDYAHTPDALQKTLEALRPYTSGQLYCIFGCGGDRDRRKRPLMGAVAEHYADKVIMTADNPRYEDIDQIVQDMLVGIKDPKRVIIELDRQRAIVSTIAAAKTGDVVLIAGKGHTAYQLIGDTQLPFSDQEEVRKALAYV